jgi:hypothetical protein
MLPEVVAARILRYKWNARNVAINGMNKKERSNYVSLEQVSKPVFGITSRRYRDLAQEEVVPPVVKGKIDFVRAAKALIEYYRKLAEAGGNLSLQEERRLKVQIERKLKELEYMVETKELIPKEEILNEFLGRITIVKQGLMGFHRSLPPILMGKEPREMADILKRQTWQLLDKFSRRSGIFASTYGRKKK